VSRSAIRHELIVGILDEELMLLADALRARRR